MKRLISVFLTLLIVLSFSGCAQIQERINSNKYEKAAEMTAEGDNKGALKLYTQLGDYMDSATLAQECQKLVSYDEAVEKMDSGDYSGAREIFKTLGGIKDSGAKAAECDDRENIEKAKALIADEDYQGAYDILRNIGGNYDGLEDLKKECCDTVFLAEATEYFSAGNYLDALRSLSMLATGDFERVGQNAAYGKAYENCKSCGREDIESMAKDCYNELCYAEAMSYYDAGSWDMAIKGFTALGDFNDAGDMAASAEKEKKEAEAAAEAARQLALQSSYDKAVSLYSSGYYYSAYCKFIELGDYSDASSRANSCRQAMPANGSMKYSSGSDCNLAIYAPGGSDSVYIKVYSGGSLVGSVFLSPGASSTIGLSAGSYTIKAAYGDTWWGTAELFGDNGYYSLLTNQSGGTTFNLESGYDYSLQLSVSSGGNVGSRSVGRSGF